MGSGWEPGEQGDSEWAEWRGEHGDMVCLYCPASYPLTCDLLNHMKVIHGFDFVGQGRAESEFLSAGQAGELHPPHGSSWLLHRLLREVHKPGGTCGTSGMGRSSHTKPRRLGSTAILLSYL